MVINGYTVARVILYIVPKVQNIDYYEPKAKKDWWRRIGVTMFANKSPSNNKSSTNNNTANLDNNCSNKELNIDENLKKFG